jgi:hypothetical protein
MPQNRHDHEDQEMTGEKLVSMPLLFDVSSKSFEGELKYLQI